MDLNKHIIIRADATPRMGTGHIMRCIALAQAAQKEGFAVYFVSRVHVAWVRERLAQECFPLYPVQDEAPKEEKPEDLLTQIQQKDLPCPCEGKNSVWVVTDGYHFTLACQKAVQAAGYKLLVIDDYNHLPEYSCDILLNQNLGAEEYTYKGNIGKKCLGLDYVLLRQEFLEAREKAQQRIFPETPHNILITLGGGNFIEYLEKIAHDLTMPELAGRTIKVIQGAMDKDRILKAFASCPAHIEILPRVDDMPSLLLETDLCITAGGSTCWELLCLGVPFLTVEVAENQKEIIRKLYKKNIASIFCHKSIKEKQYLLCLNNSVVDGLGTKRIYLFMDSDIQIRPVQLNDINFLFRLANTETVRAMSLHTKKISFDEHQKWFYKKIEEGNPFFIIFYKLEPIGYVRFSSKTEHSTISIALIKRKRGNGIGLKAILYVHNIIFSKTDIKEIEAIIKSNNFKSLTLFKKAQYSIFLNKNNLIYLKFIKRTI